MSLLSVIIPTCNRPHLLAKCLERLEPGAQALPHERYEVIVSDDGAEHSAQRLIAAHFSWAIHAPGPRKGPAANRNNGARRGRNEWLVFSVDDCLPDHNWLSAYTDAIGRNAAS